ncbi:unnamed protein product, partial [Ascophyllum nodosum]
DLHPVTVATRKELTKALVQRFYGRVWDPDTADPSPFRDLAVMLTPPFNTGKYLDALRLTEEDEQFLPKEKEYLAPTTDGEVKDKLTGIWSDLQKRAVEAAREEKTSCAGGCREYSALQAHPAGWRSLAQPCEQHVWGVRAERGRWRRRREPVGSHRGRRTGGCCQGRDRALPIALHDPRR